MLINQILNGLKRLLFGETYKFSTRKDSTSLSGSSWTEIYHEMTETPLKLISVEFLTEKDVMVQYRIVVDGIPIFPFGEFSHVENEITRNFMIPIHVASNSFLQIEIRGVKDAKNVIILNELALIEVI